MPTDTSINQQTLLSAIRNNDEKALKILYQNNYPNVEKYVLENSGSIDQARDIFQEAFISLWRNIQLDRFHPQHETSLDAYLFRIAKNKWLDQLRLQKRNQTVALKDSREIEELELTADENEFLKSIKKNFMRLGDVCRDVLQRFYYLRQSMKTIAGAMGWTEATARNNKYRCLQQLRKLITTKNPDHE